MAILIYALVCTENARAYVGSTKGKLAKRMREHRCLLRLGNHSCLVLQHDWNRFAPHQFGFTVLETLPDTASVGQRREAELKWMGHCAETGWLYNSHRIAMQPPEGAPAKAAAARVANGYKPSAESNEKRRLAQLGKPKGHGAKISATKRRKRNAGDEIVSSALNTKVQVSDKEPRQ